MLKVVQGPIFALSEDVFQHHLLHVHSRPLQGAQIGHAAGMRLQLA